MGGDPHLVMLSKDLTFMEIPPKFMGWQQEQGDQQSKCPLVLVLGPGTPSLDTQSDKLLSLGGVSGTPSPQLQLQRNHMWGAPRAGAAHQLLITNRGQETGATAGPSAESCHSRQKAGAPWRFEI